MQDAEISVAQGQLAVRFHPLGEHEAVPRAVHRLQTWQSSRGGGSGGGDGEGGEGGRD